MRESMGLMEIMVCLILLNHQSIEFREPWFLEENTWWKPPWSGISVENYLGVKTHQRTRFKPWWFHERLPSYMCQWWYLKWFLEIHGPLASPWHADDFMAPLWCQDRLCSKNFCFPATYPRKVCRILRNSIKNVVDGFHLLPGMIDVSVSWRWNVLQLTG